MAQIIRKYNKTNFSYSEGKEVENDLYNYIKSTAKEDYGKILEQDDRWTIFYHLTDIRKGILAWYPFEKTKTCLEIGGGLGSMTDLLCDKCKSVVSIEMSEIRAESLYERHKAIDNLKIYVGDFKDVKISEKFDYITLIGVLEYQGRYGDTKENPYVDFLQRLKKFLKPNGRILIAIENRFGLKYWCGNPEDHTGLAFDGINNYSRVDSAKTFTKSDLEEIISKAGFKKNKFYYPLPDYKLPNLIYSDDYLPKKDINNRYRQYYTNYSGIVLNEQKVITDIINNHLFPYFANSFFVECTNGDCTNVKYASITYDRKKKFQTATIIYDDKVKKVPLSNEAKDDIHQLQNNLNNLKNNGIKTINCQLKNDELIMPYEKDTTFDNYLLELAKNKKIVEFIEAINSFYEYLLKTSSLSKENCLITKKICKTKTIDFGPILKIGYLDLLFHNCFYSKKNNFLIFDQEFVDENVPASFMIYRCLKNLYFNNEWLEKIISIKEIQKKYNIDRLCKYYDKYDQILLLDLKENYLNKIFERYTFFDDTIIENNQELLLNSNSIIPEHRILKNNYGQLMKINDDLNVINQNLCRANDILNKNNNDLNEANNCLNEQNQSLNKELKELKKSYEEQKSNKTILQKMFSRKKK